MVKNLSGTNGTNDERLAARVRVAAVLRPARPSLTVADLCHGVVRPGEESLPGMDFS